MYLYGEHTSILRYSQIVCSAVILSSSVYFHIWLLLLWRWVCYDSYPFPVLVTYLLPPCYVSWRRQEMTSNLIFPTIQLEHFYLYAPKRGCEPKYAIWDKNKRRYLLLIPFPFSSVRLSILTQKKHTNSFLICNLLLSWHWINSPSQKRKKPLQQFEIQMLKESQQQKKRNKKILCKSHLSC